jgi:adenylylsulfate kinase
MVRAMSGDKATNITWHHGTVGRSDRERIRGHRGGILWFTGLSGSGKSTVSHRVEQKLCDLGAVSYVLDGDNVRHGLNRDLTFTADDRTENIRRVGEVAKLFTDAATLVLCAFISPYRADRAQVRALVPSGDFIEVYVKASLEACEGRDPKGLYKKARAGGIEHFTGISSPYEEPEQAELVIDTEHNTIEQCADQVIAHLRAHGYIEQRSAGS